MDIRLPSGLNLDPEMLKRIAELRGSQPNRTYTNPVSGDRMYQPPMPTVGQGRVQPMVMPTPINLTTGKPERLMISEPSRSGLPLYEKDITGVEAARRFKEYAEANNIELNDKGRPIFSSQAEADAAYAAGYRGTGKIKLSKADIEASRKRQEEEARRPIGNLSSDMLGPLFASGVMKPDTLKRKLINDDFFVDKTGIFGEKGKKYNIQLPKDQINLAHTKFTMTPPPPPKMEGRYAPPTSNLGMPDSLIPSNIVGQSFDPSFAASFTPPPQPRGSTFGGYGQQAPMQALAPYAGMAQSNPQPTDFFPNYIPRPDPVFEQAPSPPRPVMGSGG